MSDPTTPAERKPKKPKPASVRELSDIARMDVWRWLAGRMAGYERSMAALKEMDPALSVPSIARNYDSFKFRRQAVRELLQQLDPERYRKEVRPRG